MDAPIRITGQWRTPKVGLQTGEALKQGVIGGLASLLNLLAALLPFVDAELAEDADCKALLARKTAKAAAKKDRPRELRATQLRATVLINEGSVGLAPLSQDAERRRRSNKRISLPARRISPIIRLQS